MKRLFIVIVIAISSIGAFAQTEKFVKAMEPKVIAIDTTHNVDGLKELANAFERIADAEKTQWLPYYYAALANVNAGFMMGMNGPDAAVTDPIADKAEALLNKAEALSKDNGEIFIIKKMIANLRMAPGEMSRYMKYGPEGATALQTAKKLTPENPRVTLLEAQDKFYTPEQFGGSKEEAKKLFEESIKKFESFKASSSIHPSWGLSQVQYFLSQLK